jgi:hypothetical protein
MCACNASVPAMHVCLQNICARTAPQACQVPGRARCQGGRPKTDASHRSRSTSTASTRSEHTRREDETSRHNPRKHGHDDHVPSAKACQVPGRAKCQGDRPISSHHDKTKHASTSDGPRTRGPRTREDSHQGQDARAKCQGVPSARACQVPRRLRRRLGEGGAGIRRAGLERARDGLCIGGEGVS